MEVRFFVSYYKDTKPFLFLHVDNCIYMHDRSDYKTGWELERDWEAQQKAKEEAAENGGSGANKDDDKGEYFVGSDSEDDDGLPFACFICRQPFTKPVVTKCNHYFCEKCARDRFVKKKKNDCAQCGAVTDGVFNGKFFVLLLIGFLF